MVKIAFKTETKEFYSYRLEEALRDCLKEGFEPLFVPSIIDARIEAPGDARIWQTSYTTPSIKVTGRTKQGNSVVVYAHVPNYLSNPVNIEKAINQGLVNWAGVIPQEEFQRLLALAEEGNENVFVVDYNTLKNSPSARIPLEEALQHPQTIPFLGGEERAERYLERHKELCGNKIRIWHSEDLFDKPTGLLLFIGFSEDNGGLYGNYSLYNHGNFLGTHKR